MTREEVIQAVRDGKSLRDAALRGAALRGADLSNAILTAADLRYANLSNANLRDADLSNAILTAADLRYANLRNANLSYANLSEANLSGADLSHAYLTAADLRGANLQDAEGINKYLTTPLYMLQFQPGPIRACKLINKNGEGVYQGGLTYKVGEEVSVEQVDTDEYQQCGAGINLATLDWCLKEYQPGYRLLIVEHTAEDIVAIPVGSDGKYRVRRCKVVEELDLTTVGIKETER